MNGIRMNMRMYLRTSRGLTALPIRRCVIRGVRPSATRYITVSERTASLVFPFISNAAETTETPQGTAESMTTVRCH